MKLICLTLFNTLLSIVSNSQENNTISLKTKTYIDSTYNALLKKYKVVGASIAIVDNGKIIYTSGYGFLIKKMVSKRMKIQFIE